MTRKPVQLSSPEQIRSGICAEYSLDLSREDASIDIRVVRRRRKTLAIHVEPGDVVEVRAPTNCPWSDINQFLISRFDWILAAQAQLADAPQGLTNSYEHSGHVYYLGEKLPLELVRSQFTVVERSHRTLYVACSNPAKPALVERHLMNWYRQQAEKEFSNRIARINGDFGDNCHPQGLSIRKMKARWGSCSSKGEICLNLHLIKEQPSQIDFVIAHELCHLRHFSHNKAFYRLLDQVMPDWRTRERGLGTAS